jgi:hypothetical protein
LRQLQNRTFLDNARRRKKDWWISWKIRPVAETVPGKRNASQRKV